MSNTNPKSKPRRDNAYAAIGLMLSGKPITPKQLASELHITDINARRIIKHAQQHGIVQHVKKRGQTNFYQLSTAQ